MSRCAPGWFQIFAYCGFVEPQPQLLLSYLMTIVFKYLPRRTFLAVAVAVVWVVSVVLVVLVVSVVLVVLVVVVVVVVVAVVEGVAVVEVVAVVVSCLCRRFSSCESHYLYQQHRYVLAV